MRGDELLEQPRQIRVAARVWDLPVRLVHWGIALMVVLCWVTAHNGWLAWHQRCGYSVLSLVLFRLYWGFCGSSTARFAHFLRGPRAAARYLGTLWGRGQRTQYLGHNPLGGWNVLALWALLLVEVSAGLCAVDVDGLESGPLAAYVSFAVGRQFAHLHGMVFNALLVLISLHLLAIFGHLLFARENLVTPMLTGIKRIAFPPSESVAFAKWWAAWVGIVVSTVSTLILALWL